MEMPDQQYPHIRHDCSSGYFSGAFKGYKICAESESPGPLLLVWIKLN